MAEPDAVPALRAAVCDFAAGQGVTDPPLAQLRLAVSEALTNAVIHGYRGALAGDVQIHASVVAGEVSVIVSDHGVGASPRTDSPGSGFGLPIMAQMADRFELRPADPSGTEVYMAFSR